MSMKTRINRVLWATREDQPEPLNWEEALHMIDAIVNGGPTALPRYDCLTDEDELNELPRDWKRRALGAL